MPSLVSHIDPILLCTEHPQGIIPTYGNILSQVQEHYHLCFMPAPYSRKTWEMPCVVNICVGTVNHSRKFFFKMFVLKSAFSDKISFVCDVRTIYKYNGAFVFLHSAMIPSIVHVSVSDKMSLKQYMHCHPIGPNKLWVDKSRSFYDCANLMCGTSRRRESNQLRNKRAKHIKPRVFWWHYNLALRCLISPTISFFVPKPNQTTSTNTITTVHCWPSVPVIPT